MSYLLSHLYKAYQRIDELQAEVKQLKEERHKLKKMIRTAPTVPMDYMGWQDYRIWVAGCYATWLEKALGAVDEQ